MVVGSAIAARIEACAEGRKPGVAARGGPLPQESGPERAFRPACIAEPSRRLLGVDLLGLLAAALLGLFRGGRDRLERERAVLELHIHFAAMDELAEQQLLGERLLDLLLDQATHRTGAVELVI